MSESNVTKVRIQVFFYEFCDLLKQKHKKTIFSVDFDCVHEMKKKESGEGVVEKGKKVLKE